MQSAQRCKVRRPFTKRESEHALECQLTALSCVEKGYVVWNHGCQREVRSLGDLCYLTLMDAERQTVHLCCL